MRVFLLVVALAACPTTDEPSEVELSWRFIDGRPCDLAGVSGVSIAWSDGTREERRCIDGHGDEHFVRLARPEGATSLVVEGRSITGALLYRGEGELSDETERLEVMLRFLGGELPPPP